MTGKFIFMRYLVDHLFRMYLYMYIIIIINTFYFEIFKNTKALIFIYSKFLKTALDIRRLEVLEILV